MLFPKDTTDSCPADSQSSDRSVLWRKRQLQGELMKTSELTGDALDWAVATCEGYTDLHKIEGRMPHEPQLGIFPPYREYGVMDLSELNFSSDWDRGGWIIEREKITLDSTAIVGQWMAILYVPDEEPWEMRGPTPLVAAMRCYVASKLGDEVDVPDDLL